MSSKFKVKGEGPIIEFVKYRPNAIEAVSAATKTLKTFQENLAKEGFSGVVLPDDELREAEALVNISVSQPQAKYDDWKSSAKKIVLMLDSVTDPRNLGAIIRSAAFFGIKDVVIRGTRQASLTDVVVHTSRGGLALVNLLECTNLAREARALKEMGFWVLGATPRGEPLGGWRNKFDKVCVVLGSEGAGISKNLESLCDVKVAIEGAKEQVESLNVAVAAGVLLYSLQN